MPHIFGTMSHIFGTVTNIFCTMPHIFGTVPNIFGTMPHIFGNIISHLHHNQMIANLGWFDWESNKLRVSAVTAKNASVQLVGGKNVYYKYCRKQDW